MYKVVHKERYMIEDVETEYASISDIKKRYTYQQYLIDLHVSDLKVGCTVFFDYDNYISLEITKMS